MTARIEEGRVELQRIDGVDSLKNDNRPQGAKLLLVELDRRALRIGLLLRTATRSG